MKVQLQGQGMRLRIDEAELARLQAGETIGNSTTLPGVVCLQQLRLGDTAQPAFDGDARTWCLSVPRGDLAAYVARLPCRDGLDYLLPTGADGPLAVSVEVDVRDSARVRGKARR